MVMLGVPVAAAFSAGCATTGVTLTEAKTWPWHTSMRGSSGLWCHNSYGETEQRRAQDAKEAIALKWHLRGKALVVEFQFSGHN